MAAPSLGLTARMSSFVVRTCSKYSRFLSVWKAQGLLSHPNNHPTVRLFGATAYRSNLMEFFDEKTNWGAREVRSGRSWTEDELRIKSNTDLHKLWFVLYKEKNMLLTMEAECERVAELFPNPERIYKVEESMKNLNNVVTERDRAVKLLEVGITGQVPTMHCYDFTGRGVFHRYKEHLMPYWRNPRYYKKRYTQEKPMGMMREFLLKYREKTRLQKLGQINRQQAIIHRAHQDFPDHPLWKGDKEIKDLRLEDVYHSKMSD